MRVYRYEMPDGGGPWFTKGGSLRDKEPPQNNHLHNVLYGCLSLESLFQYFKQVENKADLSKTHVQIYDIPLEDIIIIDYNQVAFPKTYKPL